MFAKFFMVMNEYDIYVMCKGHSSKVKVAMLKSVIFLHYFVY